MAMGYEQLLSKGIRQCVKVELLSNLSSLIKDNEISLMIFLFLPMIPKKGSLSIASSHTIS